VADLLILGRGIAGCCAYQTALEFGLDAEATRP
jgi:hypothetical protein